MEQRHLDFLKHLAAGVAAEFGSNCEVVVHDLTAAEHESTIVTLENGHVTGRSVSDGPSEVVLKALQHDTPELQDRLAYLTRTEDGRTLKSTTIFYRDENGLPVAVFGINFDITLLLAASETIASITDHQGGEKPVEIPNSVSDLLDNLIEQSVRLVGKPVAFMTREDKVKAIGFLNESGAFLVTKSGPKVCEFFGISKYTLYSYIDEAKKGKA